MKKLIILSIVCLTLNGSAQEQSRGVSPMERFQVNYRQVNEAPSQSLNFNQNFENVVQEMNRAGQLVIQSRTIRSPQIQSSGMKLNKIIAVQENNKSSEGGSDFLARIELPSPKPLGITELSLEKKSNVKMSTQDDREYKYHRANKTLRTTLVLPVYRWLRRIFPVKSKTKGVRMSCYF